MLDDYEIPFTYAGECRPRLRDALQRGGFGFWFDGNNTREIDSTKAIQPLVHTTRMTGVFGLIQPVLAAFTPHYIHLRNYQRNIYGTGRRNDSPTPIFEHLYEISEIEQAMDEFLGGSRSIDPICLPAWT